MAPEAKKARTGDTSPLETIKEALLQPAIQYGMLHGLLYADKNLEGDASRATQCPVAMLPYLVPAKAFHEVVALSPLWNKLVDAVARDLEWLYQTLSYATVADSFTQRLVDVCKAVHSGGLRQPVYLGIHRSDYMLHDPDGARVEPRFLQIELNTIASSMGAHASNAARLHQFLLARYGGEASGSVGEAFREHFGEAALRDAESLPENVTLQRIPAALAAAHAAYGANAAVVLFVVQGNERNFADQRWLEYRLWENHGVRVLRRTLSEVAVEGALDQPTGRLRLEPAGLEVSVVYFRAGYAPEDYHSEAEWKARAMLEASLAIKCPSIAYQLVGAKKVQQALASPGAVERFLTADESARMRTCFAGLWGLGPGEEDASIISEVQADPRLFVLKPQREGGGNNFYGEEAAAKLRELSVEERGAYILMQRVLPRPQAAVLLREGRAQIGQCISEFGFYSVFVGDGAEVRLSEHAGHLVRTKMEGVDEGGVAAGYAVISSPFLVK